MLRHPEVDVCVFCEIKNSKWNRDYIFYTSHENGIFKASGEMENLEKQLLNWNMKIFIIG